MTTKRGLGERGTVVVLYALALVAMCAVVALVIDLGQLRTVRRTDKSVADMAARAGVGRLQFGPWSGVCKARDYLLANGRGFTTFDSTTETWTNAAVPPVKYSPSPCPATATRADVTPCSPGAPATWARLQATAAGGRFTIDIQSGYSLPDPRFAEDAAQSADAGVADQGSCDNLSVIITDRQPALFARAIGSTGTTIRVRSVARLNSTETVDYVAALQLLEQHKCGVLQTGGSNTRVVAQPFGDFPGIIQIDSADDSGTCPQPIINAQATTGGPSVVACGVSSPLPICTPGTGSRTSRVGIYAMNFVRPAAEMTSAYPTTYGDTAAVGTPRTGRRFADRRYRANVAALDTAAQAVLTGNAGRPPGCGAVSANSCTGNGVTWLVLEPTDCANLATFFLVPGRTLAPRIWFHCDLNVTAPLALTAPGSTLVVTGQLAVKSSFVISDPRTLYVGGRSTGDKIGLDVGGAGSILSVNQGAAPTCSARTGAGHTTTLVVGNGSLQVASGSAMKLCQTFVDLASGFGKVPASDGTSPCSSPCSSYLGTINVSSGAVMDWSAPNEVTGRLVDVTELTSGKPYEDLALWSEAGGNTNGLSGGATTSLSGIYFLPNADSFNLAGGGALPIYLSAQFICTSLKVTGGATVNLVPTPYDSVPVTVYSTLLVR